MNSEETLISLLCGVLLAALVLLAAIPTIDRWERANGYPYGRMCNSVFTLYVDTCRGVR